MLRRSRYRYKQIGKSAKNMGFSLPKVKKASINAVAAYTYFLHTHILLYELKN